MKKFTTIFWLTKGIVEVEISGQTTLDYWELQTPIDGMYRILKKECFDSFNDAVKRAKVLKARHIRQLKKQLEKVTQTSF